jgi:hypothetical protein
VTRENADSRQESVRKLIARVSDPQDWPQVSSASCSSQLFCRKVVPPCCLAISRMIFPYLLNQCSKTKDFLVCL